MCLYYGRLVLIKGIQEDKHVYVVHLGSVVTNETVNVLRDQMPNDYFRVVRVYHIEIRVLKGWAYTTLP